MRSFFICLLFLLACTAKNNENKLAFESNSPAEAPKSNILGKLQFSDLEGEKFSGDHFSGKPLFVNFWATWCGPCVKEMPSIEIAMKAVPEVTFILLSDENIAEIKEFKYSKGLDLNFLQLNSDMGMINVYSLPTTILIDKKGQVVETVVGAKDWSSEGSIKQLKELVQM